MIVRVIDIGHNWIPVSREPTQPTPQRAPLPPRLARSIIDWAGCSAAEARLLWEQEVAGSIPATPTTSDSASYGCGTWTSWAVRCHRSTPCSIMTTVSPERIEPGSSALNLYG